MHVAAALPADGAGDDAHHLDLEVDRPRRQPVAHAVRKGDVASEFGVREDRPRELLPSRLRCLDHLRGVLQHEPSATRRLEDRERLRADLLYRLVSTLQRSLVEAILNVLRSHLLEGKRPDSGTQARREDPELVLPRLHAGLLATFVVLLGEVVDAVLRRFAFERFGVEHRAVALAHQAGELAPRDALVRRLEVDELLDDAAVDLDGDARSPAGGAEDEGAGSFTSHVYLRPPRWSDARASRTSSSRGSQSGGGHSFLQNRYHSSSSNPRLIALSRSSFTTPSYPSSIDAPEMPSNRSNRRSAPASDKGNRYRRNASGAAPSAISIRGRWVRTTLSRGRVWSLDNVNNPA
ncbi:MAG TPA: hypothetical protein VH062_10165 [Polyangiaceae bacterium]|nr:hypothetical protein [Polyangiaceae bacterium]